MLDTPPFCGCTGCKMLCPEAEAELDGGAASTSVELSRGLGRGAAASLRTPKSCLLIPNGPNGPTQPSAEVFVLDEDARS